MGKKNRGVDPDRLVGTPLVVCADRHHRGDVVSASEAESENVRISGCDQ